MARLGRLGFLGLAIVFHVIYVLSIFDVYFRSPIVSGMRAFSVDSPKAPAKRLVLYVGDGLRADKAFQWFPDPSPSDNDTTALEPRPLAPFLRSKVLHDGTFGVSHTRVPTESRPGHVALIAGLYEDVSAVTTGWKLNPVNFDSVFNRSRHTWQWGSPDILPMFSAGAIPGRVTDDTYGAEFEDFSKDATELDYYVFDHVKQLFKGAEADAALNARLREDKVVFFLHLLGLDTTGHSYRPYSKEYLHNIKVVDQGVQEITKVVEDFYGDDETAFVFTADHGMSDWGSHGDGHPDNTRTPLVAWGAGVAKPKTVPGGKAPGHDDGFSHDWQLDHVQRHDVAQADIAILMANLAGLEYPVNSVGEVPLSFLAADDEQKAKAMLVNARQILEMYHVKEVQKSAQVLRYKPYGRFASANQTIERRLEHIEGIIDNGNYELAIARSDELIQLGLQGLRYLQTYDWLFLRTLVTLGYVGWIAFAFTTAVDAFVLDGSVDATRTTMSIVSFGSILVALYSFLLVQSSPLTYYLYASFPVMFWEEVIVRRRALVEGKNKLFAKFSQQDVVKLALYVGAYLAILEVMVQSYYYREIYSICYIVGAAWPALYGTDFISDNILLCATWALGCLSMSIFTFLPAIKTEDATMIMLGGGLMLVLGMLYIAFEKGLLSASVAKKEGLAAPKADGISRSILGVQHQHSGTMADTAPPAEPAPSPAPAAEPAPESPAEKEKEEKEKEEKEEKEKEEMEKEKVKEEKEKEEKEKVEKGKEEKGEENVENEKEAKEPVVKTAAEKDHAEGGKAAKEKVEPAAPPALETEVKKVTVVTQAADLTPQPIPEHEPAPNVFVIPAASTAPGIVVIQPTPVTTPAATEIKADPLASKIIPTATSQKATLPSVTGASAPSTTIETTTVKPALKTPEKKSITIIPQASTGTMKTGGTSASQSTTVDHGDTHSLRPKSHRLVSPFRRHWARFMQFFHRKSLSSLGIPFLHALQPNKHYLHRLVVIFLAFAPTFIILTISYEGLFYLAITITLVSWVRLEHRIYQRFSSAPARDPTKPRALALSDARICLFFLFLLQSAFFSAGNISSISSFSLDAVYRLIPIFDPFSQGALLVLKILAPFALVSANLGILTKRLQLRSGSLFAVVMGIGDYLTLRFFWEVRDEGSWLDIGESITTFVIASLLCVFVAALEALSEVFTKGIEF
ncbi:Glycosyl phosphatidyl inositol anchor synthesis [Recurvomyces mirabilis]|uniref:GPI ethanolamine phosphate transferase 1 n=1 Tax=Recurvomyces mirabilis TaxID=574656 RepID=A0AAE0WUM8_9PEZI|nr:Glycosyl phosphatidyl inositol anchor synthesis [Recurvomyces mirabilis]